MAKSIAKSCPLCLSVNDPVDMLAVTMPHSTPPQSAPLYLCRLCVLDIMKAAIGSELIDPAEVFPNATARDDSDREIQVVALMLLRPVILWYLGISELTDDPPVDRREPEMPAGGAGDAKEPEEGGLSLRPWARRGCHQLQRAGEETEIDTRVQVGRARDRACPDGKLDQAVPA